MAIEIFGVKKSHANFSNGKDVILALNRTIKGKQTEAVRVYIRDGFPSKKPCVKYGIDMDEQRFYFLPIEKGEGGFTWCSSPTSASKYFSLGKDTHPEAWALIDRRFGEYTLKYDVVNNLYYLDLKENQ